MLLCRGKKDGQKNQKDLEKEEMYRQQQEMLEARRSGTALQEANQRRAKVAVSNLLCRPLFLRVVMQAA